MGIRLAILNGRDAPISVIATVPLDTFKAVRGLRHVRKGRSLRLIGDAIWIDFRDCRSGTCSAKPYRMSSRMSGEPSTHDGESVSHVGSDRLQSFVGLGTAADAA